MNSQRFPSINRPIYCIFHKNNSNFKINCFIEEKTDSDMGKIYAVGVGPGSPSYVTHRVKNVVLGCDIVVGYKYTLNTISKLISGKEVHEITMKNQEEAYKDQS